MYNDTIKVANKIISYDDLFDIFSKMNEKLEYYKKLSYNEERQNRMLDYSYQKWSFKDDGSSLSFSVEFDDNTNIKFDNYNNFIAIFNSRLSEIRYIYVRFSLSYSASLPSGGSEYYNQYINMMIYENEVDMDISLNSQDSKIDDVYELIKNKILNAPIRYDDVVKRKGIIKSSVGLAIGLIPALLISICLLFVPVIRHVFAESYVLYPICTLFIAFVVSEFLETAKLDKLYKNIVPEKEYVGYNSNKGKSIYKDNIDKYIQTSEILIGKNVDNLKCREEIMNSYNKYKKILPYELLVMIVLSIIVIFLAKL